MLHGNSVTIKKQCSTLNMKLKQVCQGRKHPLPRAEVNNQVEFTMLLK